MRSGVKYIIPRGLIGTWLHRFQGVFSNLTLRTELLRNRRLVKTAGGIVGQCGSALIIGSMSEIVHGTPRRTLLSPPDSGQLLLGDRFSGQPVKFSADPRQRI
jgi:hypothetical protein